MFRRALPVVTLLLLIGAAGWGAASLVIETDGAPRDEIVDVAAVERVEDALGTGAGRERRHVRPAGSTEPELGDGQLAAPRSPSDASGAPRTDDYDAAQREVALDQAERLIAELEAAIRSLDAPDPALHATPDRDALTDAPVTVAPALQPALPFATFVSRGSDAVQHAVELVGERAPALEEGVPVALTGRVVARADGVPIVGAEVVVTSTFYVRSTFYDHHLREVARATTDTDGVFTIERLNADPAHFGRGGKAYVTASAQGFVTVRGAPLAEVSPGIRNRLDDVVLARAPHVLRGRVIDLWDGAPVVGARVVATGTIDPVVYPKDQREALFVGAPQATTDADGRFLLEDLPNGVQMVSVHGGDDCLGRQAFTLPDAADVEIRTRAIGGRVEGRVVDAFGEPIPLVYVEGGSNATHSFADGHFVLENIRGDTVTVRLAHPEFMAATVRDVADGATGLVVRLEHRLPVVTLDVRAAETGAAVSEIAVLFESGDNPPRAPTSPAHLATDGLHRVTLPLGTTSLVVGCVDRETANVAATPLRDGDVVRLDLALRDE